MNTKLLSLVLLAALLIGAYLVYSQVLTIAYPVVPKEVRVKLLDRLNAEGVWHQEEDDGIVRFMKKDMNKVLELGRVASEQVIPMNRSFSPAPNMLQETILRLRKRGIKFETREVAGVAWIILDKEYEGQVEEIWFENI